MADPAQNEIPIPMVSQDVGQVPTTLPPNGQPPPGQAQGMAANAANPSISRLGHLHPKL